MSFQKKPFKRFSTEQISGRLNIQSANGLTCSMPPTQLKQILTMMTSFHPYLSDEP
ncbi:hypothetical protein OO184_24125 [Photorhabdus sp. APURE]|uniref:hypothetical protein n=1 Tax=Photorhabdus aballayi TaxID=2991723 RepID=UPI00223DF65E|nr:hypothetical protein [Photorhabdus aballayi]MCW7550928.1 hypothetical protein [Photorhabdus aballayi]